MVAVVIMPWVAFSCLRTWWRTWRFWGKSCTRMVASVGADSPGASSTTCSSVSSRSSAGVTIVTLGDIRHEGGAAPRPQLLPVCPRNHPGDPTAPSSLGRSRPVPPQHLGDPLIRPMGLGHPQIPHHTPKSPITPSNPPPTPQHPLPGESQKGGGESTWGGGPEQGGVHYLRWGSWVWGSCTWGSHLG